MVSSLGSLIRSRDTTAVFAVLFVAFAWALALLHRGHPLVADEIEFFRATRWIAEGLVPYRDYWEHHLPFQWFLFAPVAAVTGHGTGVDSVIALRWAQLPLWIALFALSLAILRRLEISAWGRWSTLLLLVGSPWFVWTAVEYRLDVPGNLAFIAALSLSLLRRETVLRWVLFGVLMSLAVLSNMRLAPLAVVAALLLSFWRTDDERWGWNGRALWMIAGVVPVVAAFLGYLALTGAGAGFQEGVFEYNRISGQLLPPEARSFRSRLALILVKRDVVVAGFILAAIIGGFHAARRLARPGFLQITLLLVVASLIGVAAMGVHYEYHFQNALLLMFPLAASVIDRMNRLRILIPAGVLAIGLGSIGSLVSGTFGTEIRYQDAVMRAADRMTPSDGRVLDGCGYALRRDSPYRYWFLPAGVRMMAHAGLTDPYDLEQISAAPPDLIVYDHRVHYWMMQFPRLRAFAQQHYVPLFQGLWIPGMSVIVEPGPAVVRWVAPVSGQYDVWSSPLLASHPWMTHRHRYSFLVGVDLAIPLDRLPQAIDERLRWVVDGVAAPEGVRTLTLQRGSRVELQASVASRTGVLLVPRGVRMLSIMPEVPFFL